MHLYNEAAASYSRKSSETFSSLIDYFKDCSEYKDLGEKSKRAYDDYLKLIEVKFGAMPIGALEDKRLRGDFKEFRDSFSDTAQGGLRLDDDRARAVGCEGSRQDRGERLRAWWPAL